MSEKTKYPVAFLVPFFIFLMASIPMGLAISPIIILDSTWMKIVAASLSPVIFVLSFTSIAGVLSLPFSPYIVSGKFPRDITDKVYGPRRMYGLCWGAVFYFTPVYYAFMSVPSLRTFMLRLFGYRGAKDIALAPDAWIRDLPLLKFEKGIYVANKATIGTNICLADGNIMVGAVTLKEKALVGHLSMVAPGTVIGKNSEVGVGSGIGIRVQIGDEVRVGPTTTLNHGCKIGNKANIGTKSYIGIRAIIGDGITLPPGSNIPDGAVIKTQSDVESYISSESRVLNQEKTRLENLFVSRNTKIKNLNVVNEE